MLELQSLSEVQPFVVFGPSKSGTTWVQTMLDSHSDVRCHFQLPLFTMARNDAVYHPDEIGYRKLFLESDEIYNGLKSPFNGVFPSSNDQMRYYYMLDLLSRIKQEFCLGKPLSRENSRNAALCLKKEIAESTYKRFALAMLVDQPGKRIYGTKAYTDFELFFRLFPLGKAVIVLRDGRDVAISKRYHYLRSQLYFNGDEKNIVLRYINRNAQMRGLFRYFESQYPKIINNNWFRDYRDKNEIFNPAVLKKIAVDWQLVIDYLLSWKQHCPDQIMVVRYEDLKADTSRELQKVFKYLGVTTSKTLINNIVEKSKKASGKTMSNESFFRSGQVGEWSSYFTVDDKKQFKQYAGETLMKLGYVDHTSW